MLSIAVSYVFFFFNDTATTEIYPLSLHDALPISRGTLGAQARASGAREPERPVPEPEPDPEALDRKSTRLNSSHLVISYAVFCLKKKKLNMSQCTNEYYCLTDTLLTHN